MTYLNKGSQYSMLVEDTSRTESNPGKKVYRTSVQVVFDTEPQRQQPLAYWQLWEQNRDDDEVRSFEGRSQAIEYVGPHGSDRQDHMAKLQAVHSDGFSLMWSVDENDTRQFSFTIRSNFRSTDFSHCKGVIGVAMQLCSKTEEVLTNSVQPLMPNLEMRFCRIKLFRSHGAERKNANDTAIAEKRIKKLQQQLAQLQTGQTKDKRLGRDKSKTRILPGARRNQEDDLLCKIKNLQRNCTSIQPYTFLGHQGQKQPDCDWPPLARDNKSPESPEALTSAFAAPRSGLMPMTSRPKHSMSGWQSIKRPTPTWDDESQQKTLTRDLPESIKNRTMGHGETKVACFYIRPVGFKHLRQDDHYIAVYLCERTACDLIRGIAEAVSVDLSKVGRIIWSHANGLSILVDDDVVANMIEGQHLQVEAKTIAPRSYFGRESSPDSSGEVYCREHEASQGAGELLELKLMF